MNRRAVCSPLRDEPDVTPNTSSTGAANSGATSLFAPGDWALGVILRVGRAVAWRSR